MRAFYSLKDWIASWSAAHATAALFLPGARFLRKRAAFLAAAGLLVFVNVAGLLLPVDNGLAALRARLVQRDPTGSIVVATIDPESLREFGEWPWPRQRFARALENLQEAGATLIGVDVDFSLRSASGDDRALAAAIGLAPGSIVLPTFLQRDRRHENAPLAALSRDAVFAAVNIPLDSDGLSRRYFRTFRHGGRARPSMAAVLSDQRYDEEGSFLVDYGIRASRIERVSFADISEGRFDAEKVRGRVVLIGATAMELGDTFATPVDPAAPGVIVHALAFESLVQGRALNSLNDWLTLALGLIVLFALWPRERLSDHAKPLVRHGAIFAAIIITPLAFQMLAPVSLDSATLLAAQAISIWVAVRRELKHRAEALSREREAHLTHVAMHYPETQLPNHRAMIWDLGELMATPGQGPVAVLVVGIDRFAAMRGAIGYTRANEVVSSLAGHLRTSLKKRRVYQLSMAILGVIDDVGGGDQALAGGGLNPVLKVGEQEIEVPLRVGMTSAAMSQETTPEKLLEEASLALDEARTKKRGLVAFDARSAVNPRLRFALLSDMSKGLESGEFHLHYQPKVSLSERRIVGAEALARWTHPIHGPIPPAHFIKAAEETGAIDPLTRWAITQAIGDQAEMRKHDLALPIALNLSGRSLSDGRLCDFAVKAVRKSKADLCFEITETAVIEDPVQALVSIDEYRAAGIQISIDDYGTGLSALSYLKSMNADELKLDKSLIAELTANTRDRLIVKSTIDLAHGLGLKVVAEGVEDEATLAILASLGCDLVQGYLIARPMPMGAFIFAAKGWKEEGAVSQQGAGLRMDFGRRAVL